MKKTNVILTTITNGHDRPTNIKLGTWTEEQKQEFLNHIKGYTPIETLVTDDCSFNVHFDKEIIHSRAFDTPKEFIPHCSKNKSNELIVEMIPGNNRLCWPSCPSTCSMCLQDGDCTSPFIRNIGEILFPNKYGNQR